MKRTSILWIVCLILCLTTVFTVIAVPLITGQLTAFFPPKAPLFPSPIIWGSIAAALWAFTRILLFFYSKRNHHQ